MNRLYCIPWAILLGIAVLLLAAATPLTKAADAAFIASRWCAKRSGGFTADIVAGLRGHR